ncbi:MAG TPA: TerC family protein [Spirochaetota bacterium]|nr:TerC family protein [Spirochaetota bacterium]HOM09144.1 TerC family protein [Spirochaetota bacterium]HPP49007.1 TerC family protein [Spirochaetota bacterium]
MTKTLLWVGFNVFVLLMLLLDLGVFNRKAHEIKVKEAVLWTIFWIVLSLMFNLGIYFYAGYHKALLFFTAYLVEKSLSMDNIFVFLMLFTYFKVHPMYQHKVLFWGVLGALIMRAIFIFAGIALIEKFDWILYIFGAFLIYTGYKMMKEKDKEIHPEKNPVLKLARAMLPVTSDYRNGYFFVKENGKRFVTPLFIVLLVIESTDVLFAVDSIPAVLAISHDPFIVYTSNVMAILGLRALYFALAAVMRLFRFLHYGLSVILIYVGCKMIAAQVGYHIPTEISLGIIAFVLTASIVTSIYIPEHK